MMRYLIVSANALAVVLAAPMAAKAEGMRQPAASLPVPPGATEEQVLLGDRIFHGEAANGKCSECHGADAKGTANGNDLTLGMWIWGDGSLRMIKGTITHNMAMAALSEQRQVVCVGRSKRRPKRRLGREGAPLGQRGGAPLFVNLAGDEMALLIEMVVDLGMN